MMRIASFCFCVFLVFALCMGFPSCKNGNGQLQLPSLAREELSPRIDWALVSDPYVACHKDAGYESLTIASFRKGELYEIKGNCTIVVDKGEKDEKKELWYALGDGWVPSSAVKVYSNKLKAEHAKKSLLAK